MSSFHLDIGIFRFTIKKYRTYIDLWTFWSYVIPTFGLFYLWTFRQMSFRSLYISYQYYFELWTFRSHVISNFWPFKLWNISYCHFDLLTWFHTSVISIFEFVVLGNFWTFRFYVISAIGFFHPDAWALQTFRPRSIGPFDPMSCISLNFSTFGHFALFSFWPLRISYWCHVDFRTFHSFVNSTLNFFRFMFLRSRASDFSFVCYFDFWTISS